MITVPAYYKYVLIIIVYKSCVVIIFLYFTVSRPEKNILLKLLFPLMYKWYEIGGLLGVDDNIIESLSVSIHSDGVKMSKMLQEWLDNEPSPVTWRNIIDIIEGPLQNRAMGAMIRQELNLCM